MEARATTAHRFSIAHRRQGRKLRFFTAIETGGCCAQPCLCTLKCVSRACVCGTRQFLRVKTHAFVGEKLFPWQISSRVCAASENAIVNLVKLLARPPRCLLFGIVVCAVVFPFSPQPPPPSHLLADLLPLWHEYVILETASRTSASACGRYAERFWPLAISRLGAPCLGLENFVQRRWTGLRFTEGQKAAR